MSTTHNAENDGDEQFVNDNDTDGMDRRAFLRRSATAVGTAAAIGAGTHRYAPEYSPIGGAQAIAPIIVGAYAGGALVATGSAYAVWGGGEQVDPEDLREAEASNIHQSTYSSAAALYAADEGFTNEVVNSLAPENPDQGAFASQLTGYMRRRTYEGIVNGDTTSSTTVAIQEDIDNHVAERKKNALKQWDEYAIEVARNLWIIIVESEVNDELSPGTVFNWEFNTDAVRNYIIGNVEPGTDGWRDEIKQPSDLLIPYEITLDNGDVVESHTVPWPYYAGNDDFDAYAHPAANIEGEMTGNPVGGIEGAAWNDRSWTGSNTEDDGATVENPHDRDDHQSWVNAGTWETIYETFHEYPDEIRAEVGDYVSTAYEQHEQGDLDPDKDLRDSDDYVQDYSSGDSDSAATDAVVAEYLSMGYVHPGTPVVEVDAPGAALDEGVLLLNWDFERVAPWEYDASNYPEIEFRNNLVGDASLTFEVNNDDLAEPETVVVSADDVDGIRDVDPGEESVTFDVTDIDPDAPASGFIDDVSRSPEGSTTVWIDEGQDVSSEQYVHAVLVEQTDELPERSHLNDGFELVNVEDADRYTAERYFSRSRDTTRTKEDVDREVEGYTRTEEIITEVEIIPGGGGSVLEGDNTLLYVAGGAIASLLAALGLQGVLDS